MQVAVVRPDELTTSELRLWSDLQQSSADYASPYFCPQFTLAVASVRGDVRVGVLESGGRTVGFFPFQRVGPRVAEPVGGKLSDYHGVIVAEGVGWTAEEVVRGCGLDVWAFSHLLVSQRPFHAYHSARTSSPVIDLSGGFEAYLSARRRAGGLKHYGRLMQQRRRLEREIGPLRYEAHVPEGELLARLMKCKSSQYLRAGYPDQFAIAWFSGVVERIFAIQEEGFAGLLSILYAGDRVVASHFGMRSRTVWHYWFPCYDRAILDYSPGLLLLLEMARGAEALGIEQIDLGKGGDHYKQRLMTSSVAIAEGSVVLGPCAAGCVRPTGTSTRGERPG